MICIKNNSLLITGIVAVVVAAVAFFGGIEYQKSKSPANSFFASGGQQGNNQGRRFGAGAGRNGGAVVGEILSADENSITVKLMDGSSKIVVVSSSTSINKAATASKSDLKTGERVAVFGSTNSDGSVTAQNIQLNPTMMRFGGAGPKPTGEMQK